MPCLQALIASDHQLVALVTQPDKPAGRGHRLRMPPTKPIALAAKIDVLQPRRVRNPESVEAIEAIAPDCVVVVAYGQIIPKTILDIPSRGIVNVHGSLLPKYRGAAPIQWAIVHGEHRTGVTTMLMDEGLDTGPILQTREMDIEHDDTAVSLSERMAPLGAALLLETLTLLNDGRCAGTPQDDSRATKAPLIKPHHAEIDWRVSAQEIDCLVRGLNPWPVAKTTLGNTPVKIFRARPGEEPTGNAPGTICAVSESILSIACGESTQLELLEVQAQGKRRMSAGDFARGRHLSPGDRVE